MNSDVFDYTGKFSIKAKGALESVISQNCMFNLNTIHILCIVIAYFLLLYKIRYTRLTFSRNIFYLNDR